MEMCRRIAPSRIFVNRAIESSTVIKSKNDHFVEASLKRKPVKSALEYNKTSRQLGSARGTVSRATVRTTLWSAMRGSTLVVEMSSKSVITRSNTCCSHIAFLTNCLNPWSRQMRNIVVPSIDTCEEYLNQYVPCRFKSPTKIVPTQSSRTARHSVSKA